MFRNLKNLIAFLEFKFLRLFFRRTYYKKKNILFVNTGQIGDLMVSSLILENEHIFPSNTEIYLTLNEKYKHLFDDYSGKLKFIYFNQSSLKFNLFYKIIFLSKIRKLRILITYNLSPARGMLGEQISLLSSSEKVITTCINNLYLGSFWGNVMNKYYDKILFDNIKNEYEKHLLLLNRLNVNKEKVEFNNNKVFNPDSSEEKLKVYGIKNKKFILIAPLTGDMKRSWGIENFKKLVEKLSINYKIVLIGANSESENLRIVKNNNKDVLIITPHLNEISYFVFHSGLFIGNHSGLTHFALKMNIPFIAILDGGFFDMYMPFDRVNSNNNYIFYKMECYGCQMHCIFPEPYCLTKIKIDEVLTKVKEILD